MDGYGHSVVSFSESSTAMIEVYFNNSIQQLGKQFKQLRVMLLETLNLVQ